MSVVSKKISSQKWKLLRVYRTHLDKKVGPRYRHKKNPNDHWIIHKVKLKFLKLLREITVNLKKKKKITRKNLVTLYRMLHFLDCDSFVVYLHYLIANISKKIPWSINKSIKFQNKLGHCISLTCLLPPPWYIIAQLQQKLQKLFFSFCRGF